MTKLSLREAAAESGIPKTTLRRAIDLGKISVERTEAGHLLIDPSELGRFMDVRQREQTAPRSPETAPWDTNLGQSGTPVGQAWDTTSKLHEMEMRARLAEQRAEMLNSQNEDLRRDRDAWRAQAERLLIEGPSAPATVILPPTPDSPTQPDEDQRVSLWRRLFGR